MNKKIVGPPSMKRLSTGVLNPDCTTSKIPLLSIRKDAGYGVM